MGNKQPFIVDEIIIENLYEIDELAGYIKELWDFSYKDMKDESEEGYWISAEGERIKYDENPKAIVYKELYSKIDEFIVKYHQFTKERYIGHHKLKDGNFALIRKVDGDMSEEWESLLVLIVKPLNKWSKEDESNYKIAHKIIKENYYKKSV